FYYTQPPATCGTIATGLALPPGKSISSCDGAYSLNMQTDGNLVLYHSGSAVWSSSTWGAGYILFVQGDGNLVIYSAAQSPVWESGTGGSGTGNYLKVEAGHIRLYKSDGSVLWSSR